MSQYLFRDDWTCSSGEVGLPFHSGDRETYVWRLADSFGWLTWVTHDIPSLNCTVNRKVQHFQPGKGVATRASDILGMSAWFTPPDRLLWPAKRCGSGWGEFRMGYERTRNEYWLRPWDPGAIGPVVLLPFFPLGIFPSARHSRGNHGGASSQTYIEKWIGTVQWVDCGRRGDVVLRFSSKKELTAQLWGVCPADSLQLSAPSRSTQVFQLKSCFSGMIPAKDWAKQC